MEFLDLHHGEESELPSRLEQKAFGLKEELKTKFAEYLFSSGEWHDPKEEIEISPLMSLLYFHQVASVGEATSFDAVCRDGSLIEFDIGELLMKDSVPKKFLPTLGLASMDTEFFNIRIAILPPSRLARFRNLTVRYEHNKDSVADGSLGLFSDIASLLSPEIRNDEDVSRWNLWRVFNQTHKNNLENEEGRMTLVMEHEGRKPTDKEVGAIKNQVLANSANRFGKKMRVEVDVDSISPRRLFVSMRSAKYFDRRKEVLDWCRELAGEIGVLPKEIVTVDSHVDPSVTELVKTEMLRCSGFLQFFMFEREEGELGGTDWLNAEYFLARAHGIPCIRIVDPDLVPGMLFDRDKATHELKPSASKEKFSDMIRRALGELDEKIGDLV